MLSLLFLLWRGLDTVLATSIISKRRRTLTLGAEGRSPTVDPTSSFKNQSSSSCWISSPSPSSSVDSVFLTRTFFAIGSMRWCSSFFSSFFENSGSSSSSESAPNCYINQFNIVRIFPINVITLRASKNFSGSWEVSSTTDPPCFLALALFLDFFSFFSFLSFLWLFSFLCFFSLCFLSFFFGTRPSSSLTSMWISESSSSLLWELKGV